MDRFDIYEMLNGQNILSLDTCRLENVDIQEIIEGLLLHYEQLRQRGKDDYIEFLQREGRFSSFENAAAELVAGIEIDTQRIHWMPEKDLRTWISSYLEMLSRERWKAEKSTVFKNRHGGIGWMLAI